MMSEKDYPSTGRKGECKFNAEKVVVNVSSVKEVKKENVDSLEAALMKEPVIVGVDAGNKIFQMYTSGIIDSKDCGDKIDHMLLAVGYGSEADGSDYYILKNSWGTSWGEHGYVRIAAQPGKGVCGIQEFGQYPVTV